MVSFRDFVVILLRQRRTTWILLSIVYITTVWSWTSQRILFVPLAARPSTTSCIQGCRKTKQHRPASFSRISLLNYGQEDRDFSNLARNDSELVTSLIQARTTKEVEITLKNALSSKYVKIKDASQLYPDETEQTVDDTDVDTDAVDIPFSCFSLNATAATLRRMAHISVVEARSKVTATPTSANHLKLQKKLIASLLEAVGIKLMSHRSSLAPSALQQNKPKLQKQSYPGVYPLSDILQALAVLAPNDAKKEKMRPFAVLVVEFLETHETSELYKLEPIQLVQCLQAMAKLDIDHPSLWKKNCQKLLKGDVLARIPTRFLAHGLSAIAKFQTARAKREATKAPSDRMYGEENNIKEINDNEEINTDMILLSRAFMRRLRKPKIAKEATVDDMCRALAAASTLLDLGVMKTMEDDAAMFGFAGLRTILEMRENTHNKPSLMLTPTQVTDMISSWASLNDQRREDTVISKLLQICTDDKIIEKCSVVQLERIVQSMRKLNVGNNVEMARRVGERFLALAEENAYIYPNYAIKILRWPALDHRRNDTVMEPFIKTALLLFGRKSFLERSSVEEISNFLWFLSIAHCFDEEILLNIGNCLLEDDMVDDCSPNTASRILSTFTSLLALEEGHSSESLNEVKQDLFYSYGGHLLSSKLSPAAISNALCAYANANYVQDRGVFDHLVNLLESLKEKSSSRQLSESLWSCGKIIAWERQEMELLDDEDSEMEDPPYLENALKIAEELSRRAEELSPSDVAQIFWGIGRLEIEDDELVSVFANRTIEISSSMNSVEVSNVLWGIAKVQFRDGKLVGSLSDRLAADDIIISSPQVASSILFSLGRLQWKDETVYQKLTEIMIDQIQDVNAQSVANTLWAFSVVRLRPPQELLNTWALTRLGLVPANGMEIKD